MSYRGTLLLLIALLVGAAGAVDDESVTRLEALMAASDSVHADFHQVLLDEEGAVLQEAEGELWVLRPDRFRWDYRAPFDQLIVSDGARVWIYDRELAQVTVRPIDSALASSPAALLSGSSNIRESFSVLSTETTGGITTVGLAPLSQDTDFDRVDVSFDERQVRSLRLSDALGQVTVVELDEIERGGEIDHALFEFEAPEGVDVLGNAEPDAAEGG